MKKVILPLLSLLVLAIFLYPQNEDNNSGKHYGNVDLHDSSQTYPKRSSNQKKMVKETKQDVVSVRLNVQDKNGPAIP